MCPGDVASKEKQDLYAIHGLNPGEYDDIIPASWLCCPPTRLDADDVEMDALRVSRLLPIFCVALTHENSFNTNISLAIL